MVRLIKFYRRWVSPLLPPRCRFYPSCSEYALTAIELHGGLKGAALATKRLCRCHPLCAGGYDPVPGSEPLYDEKAVEKTKEKTDEKTDNAASASHWQIRLDAMQRVTKRVKNG